MPESSSPPPPVTPRLTLIRGSYADAYRTFWKPWKERSGPVAGHLGLAILLNALIAASLAFGVASFDQISVLDVFWHVLLYSESIGLSIMTIHDLGQSLIGVERLHGFGPFAKGLYWGGLSLAGGYLGFLFANFLRIGAIGADWNPIRSVPMATTLGLVLIISFAIYSLAANASRASEARQWAERESLRSLAAESAVAQAQLKLLQAQIEPHFLFNALANVVSLIDTRPSDARGMLEDLIRYLRETLALTRQASTTLGAELDIMRAYLSVFRYRMGERLAFSIEVDDALRGIPLAPMLLQPIVENALKHGLEPKIDGGTVAIRAAREGEQLHIEIADTGLGFQNAPTSGFGLGNVRDRLALLYGDAARLAIVERPGGGTIVTLSIGLKEVQ